MPTHSCRSDVHLLASFCVCAYIECICNPTLYRISYPAFFCLTSHMHSPYMLGEQSSETQIASWDVASGGRVGDTAGEWRLGQRPGTGGEVVGSILLGL